jgi:hypothetical protein
LGNDPRSISGRLLKADLDQVAKVVLAREVVKVVLAREVAKVVLGMGLGLEMNLKYQGT